MKKILANKKGKRTGVKLSTTNKSKLRRSKKVEYLTKVELLKERPHKNEIKSSVVDFLTKNKKALAKMKSPSKKEESKKYQYIIKQQSKEAPQKEIDLLTDYITAKSNTEAVEIAQAKFRSMYKNSKDKDSLTGLSVTPLDTKQSSYYPKDTILSWTSPEELKEKYSNVAAAAQ